MAGKEELESVKPAAKSVEDTVKALREEAASNKALNAICQIFASRKRARSEITMGSLKQTMYKEGFSFDLKEYEKALRFMANIGIGKIQLTRSGKIHALKDIKVTLQSIGLAVVSKKDTFDSINHQKKFVNLPKVSGQIASDKAPSEVSSVRANRNSESRGYKASLTVMIEGQAITFDLPRDITTKELGEILSQGYPKEN